MRESIPVESILRAYMDETVEEDVVEEIKEEVIEKPKEEEGKKESEKPHIITEEAPKEIEVPVVHALESEGVEMVRAVDTEIPEFPDLGEDASKLTFSDVDNVREADNSEKSVMAPKTVERLDEISEFRSAQRKSEYESDDEDNVRLRIQDQPVTLDNFDVHVLDQPEMNLHEDLLLSDIEVLA